MSSSDGAKTMNWKVDGMTCANCSLTISRFLEKQGMKNVRVNPTSGDVIFEAQPNLPTEKLVTGIHDLGYSVKNQEVIAPARRKPLFTGHGQRFLFCLVFTLPLMLHMFDRWIHIHWLMNPWVQLALCLPVYVVGMQFFGRSAIKSIRNGIPNMNVLIAVGATAAFGYSLVGSFIIQSTDYLFYETAATIITLVFLGNYLEDLSVQSTQRALKKLVKSQQVMANMIAFDENHQEVIFPVPNEQLRNGDLILIRTGEQVPADAKVLSGNGALNESIITGESIPVNKNPKDKIIGGSIVVDGILKAQVTSEAKDSVLARIIAMVREAQAEKPPVQKMADRISAIFVPAVLIIAALTFILNILIVGDLTASIMRSIAVLVIACPCAMGLATPAAIAVGVGRGARNGILFRNAGTLEMFAGIRYAVFDKTGTLTTGDFSIKKYETAIADDEFRSIAYSLEKYSTHPLGKAVAAQWKTTGEIRWKHIEEIKGIGMKGVTKDGTEYMAGSYKISHDDDKEKHNIYLTRNGDPIGWIDLSDTIREEAQQVIEYFNAKNITTILLTGDTNEQAAKIGTQLGISTVIAEQSPAQKLNKIEELSKSGTTIMIGDGINDAPALARATIGISLSEASQLAMQTADVVLMNSGLRKLSTAISLGKNTYSTIRQNLFWAFLYNIVAIPVAAFGFLTPTFGALVMGLSDVVLAVNSGRLYVKRLR
jgi:Cu+-exporting ATPase